ncbi:hypothetical protein VPH35_123348 [Triticum aestivum]
MLGVHGGAQRQAGNEAGATGPGGRQERFETVAARQGAAERHGTSSVTCKQRHPKRPEETWRRRGGRLKVEVAGGGLVVQGRRSRVFVQVVDGEGAWLHGRLR